MAENGDFVFHESKEDITHVKAVDAAVRHSSKAHNEKYVEKQLKQCKTQIFTIDEKVLYRYQNPHGHVPISHKIYKEHGYTKILQSDEGRENCFVNSIT